MFAGFVESPAGDQENRNLSFLLDDSENLGEEDEIFQGTCCIKVSNNDYMEEPINENEQLFKFRAKYSYIPSRTCVVKAKKSVGIESKLWEENAL